MVRNPDDVFLQPGQSVRFADRDDLLETLDRLHRRPPGREVGRTVDQREHYQMLLYLRFLAGADQNLLPLPVTLRKSRRNQDPPDFVLEWANRESESFELTDGSTRAYQQRLTLAARDGDDTLLLPIEEDTPSRQAVPSWVEILFASFLKKAQGLRDGRYSIDHLLIYDLTGLGLFVPLERGAPLLRRRIDDWHQQERPEHRFRRVSVMRDQALLLDLRGAGRLLRSKSPHFRLAVVAARDEEDLQRRLRDIDRYCRDHSIRHLKLFGSALLDRKEYEGDEQAGHRFGSGSDLDLLVEFEPGACVTLLDMARMERELGELIGFDVDLRTAEDLSRYFRQEVLSEAVDLHD